MVDPGVELRVGITHDESFGPLIFYGLAGIPSDLLGDRAFRILPLTDVDARELVRSPRAAPLLFGYRGAERADTLALEQLLLRVARLADEVPEIAELDLDPVIVSSHGVTAVDASIQLVGWARQPDRGLRRL
jgi:acyl-CoA synthetase (NDP forming)